MMKLCYDVIAALQGRTLVTAESCTGGGIGAALTGVPGASAVYKGGIISYTNEVKNTLLNVDIDLLEKEGAVSAAVAESMAIGARNRLNADIAVSVTGLAGPGVDEYGNPVGTVYIGYADSFTTCTRKYVFSGSRTTIRESAVHTALETILSYAVIKNKKSPDE